MEEQQFCPICKEEVSYSSRYPKYLCYTCSEQTTDAEGRPVAFYNTTLFGQGCQGEYRDTGEPFDGDTCYVQGIRCRAEEFRFGGIVVQVG